MCIRDSAGRVGQGVPDERVRGTAGGRDGGVDGRGGEDAGVRPREHVVGESAGVDQQQPGAGHRDQPQDACDHQPPLPPQIRTERGAGRQPDGVAEQDDAEGFHQAEAFAEAGVQGPDHEPHEQGAGRAEPDGAERDLP